MILRGDGQRVLAVLQRFQRVRADVDLPCAVCADGAVQPDIANGDHNRRTFRQAGRGAADDAAVLDFSQVNQPVAEDGADRERRHGVITDRDRQRQRAGVAIRRSDGKRQFLRAVIQRLQLRRRNGDAPAAVIARHGGQGLGANHQFNGGARRRGAAERLLGQRFADVQNAVVQEAAGVEAVRGRGGIDRHGAAVGRRVLRRVAGGGRNRIGVIRQSGERRGRYRHAPLAVSPGRAGISDVIKHHADDRARREIQRGAGDGQILAALLAVNDVIARNGV
ncbi:hypothetical protein BN136_1694 [Cronobacter universalis NCTC 9529]|nr:hypothetical protein BN136_1694 [Cronobacter universalis NCTC 9529]